MAFCPHCGKPVERGRFCAFCGGPIASDNVVATSMKLRRQRRQIRLMALTLGLLGATIVALTISGVIRRQRAASGQVSVGGNSDSAAQVQDLPAQPDKAQAPSGQVTSADEASTSQPQRRQSPAVVEADDDGTGRSSGANIGRQAAESTSDNLQRGSPGETSPQLPPASSPESTDRYPGSQPVEVKNANLPNVGIPVASEAYTTSDSVSAVVSYYTRRYPDAELREMNGQKIIAVDRPGNMKVIAVGTTGEETRIAIVRPAN